MVCEENKQLKASVMYAHRNKCRHLIHIIGILSCCALSISVQALIPRHNTILEPKYWFETILLAVVGSFYMTALSILSCFILIGLDSIKSIRVFMNVYLLMLLTWVTTYCIFFIIWSILLEYNYPMPFIGLFCNYTARFLSIAGFPVTLPIKPLNESESSKKMKCFMLYEFLCSISALSRGLLSFIFTKLENSDLECIMAILIPIFKEFTKFCLSKVMHKIVGTQNEKANAALGIRVNVNFGVFVVTRLPGARIITVICIAASDILIQLMMSFQIVWLHKKVNKKEENIYEAEKRKATLALSLAEVCEGLVPLSYALCFAMAYYGPNAKLIGNVGNDLWAYKAISDISWTYLVLFGLLLIDFLSLLLNAIIIWIYANVKLMEECSSALQKYWQIIAVMLASTLSSYFFSNDVNLGFDWTFNFCWTVEEMNYKYNSSLESYQKCDIS